MNCNAGDKRELPRKRGKGSVEKRAGDYKKRQQTLKKKKARQNNASRKFSSQLYENASVTATIFSTETIKRESPGWSGKNASSKYNFECKIRVAYPMRY